MTDITVFDGIGRTHTRPARYGEPHFVYLNHSGRPAASEIRALVEMWFARFPSEHKADLRARLRSSNDDHFLGAFLELYVHELLLRCGYSPSVPAEGAVSEFGRPDFVASTPSGAHFAVEAVVATDASRADAAATARINQALDAINEVRSDRFMVVVHYDGVPRSPVPLKKLRAAVERFLQSLDYEQVRLQAQTVDLDELPSDRFEHDGWTIVFSPIPLSAEATVSADDRIIGMNGPVDMYEIRPHESLRNVLRAKATRYGRVKLPYVIAANSMAIHLDKTAVMEALFGKEQFQFPVPFRSGAEPVMTRATDGLWHGPTGARATRVSAVLVTHTLMPWTVAVTTPAVYHNPWAANPCPDIFEHLTTNRPEGGKMVERPGLSGRDLFELPEGWPLDAERTPEVATDG